MVTKEFPGNSAYRLDADAAVQSQNVAENYSVIYWRVLIIKKNHIGYTLPSISINYGWADSFLGASVEPDLWNAKSLGIDFRNGSMNGTFTLAQGTYKLYHNAAGRANYTITAEVELMELGKVSLDLGTVFAYEINTTKAPAAPTSLNITEIDQTTLKYRFQGNSNGGSPILEWQVGYGTDPAQPTNTLVSTGTTVLTKLTPGVRYYLWARGRNKNGWGPWSYPTMRADTIAGGNVRVSETINNQTTSWYKKAVPYIKVNGEWKLARPYIRSAGVWKKSS